MPYKTQNPNLGPSGTVESFSETEWPNGRVQLGYVFEKATKGWQCVKLVDAAAGADGDVLYWKNYASYEVTPTIGNSSQNEIAGIAEAGATTVVDSYIWIRQRGLKAVKGNGTFARGNLVIGDTGNNRVIAKTAEGDAGAATHSVFTVIGRAMADLATAAQGVTPGTGKVVVLLDIAPL